MRRLPTIRKEAAMDKPDQQRGLVILSALINYTDWLDREGLLPLSERQRGELVKRFLDAHQEGNNYFMQAEQIADALAVPFQTGESHG